MGQSGNLVGRNGTEWYFSGEKWDRVVLTVGRNGTEWYWQWGKWDRVVLTMGRNGTEWYWQCSHPGVPLPFPHHSSLIHGRDNELHVLRLHCCVTLPPWFVCVCVCICGIVVNIYVVKIIYLFLLMYIMVILQVLVISEYCSSFCASAAPVHEQFQIVNYDSIIQTCKRFKRTLVYYDRHTLCKFPGLTSHLLHVIVMPTFFQALDKKTTKKRSVISFFFFF